MSWPSSETGAVAVVVAVVLRILAGRLGLFVARRLWKKVQELEARLSELEREIAEPKKITDDQPKV